MNIKICGLNQQENIEAICALRPDFIGLIFYNLSARYVPPGNAFRDFIRSIDGVHKVGVFVNETPGDVRRIVADYNLDYVQLHGDEDAAVCRPIAREVPVIKGVRLQEGFDFKTLERYEDTVSYFLFDTWTRHFGGSGQQFDWGLLEQYTLSRPFFLSGGIGVEDIPRLLRITHPQLAGVDVNSRIEESHGIKNIQKAKQFVHELRSR